jgi:flagellar hook-associated protein 3 FlgL
MIRVTDGAIAQGSLYGLQRANSRLMALNKQMSTGDQISRPSDDPSGTVKALQLRGSLSRNQQYVSSANDAIGWLTTMDSTLTQSVTLAQKARTLVVQGLNTGASTGQSSSAIADEIDALRTSLIGLANAQYNGRPVFGGTTSGPDAYDASGTYVGDSGIVQRQVGDTTTVQINQLGPDVYGPAGADLFVTLSDISTKLRTVPSTLTGTDLTTIDTAVKRLSAAQAAEGASYNRVQAAQAAQTPITLALTSELSDIQDIDLAAQAVAVSTANVTYQAALQTTANIRQTSLLDFLN